MVICKLLWQELLTMQVANITKELNSSDREKEVLELRLRQGLLQAGYVEGKISSVNAKSSRSIWKTNLICLALSKAKELNLEFCLLDTTWKIEGTGPCIKDILGKKLFDRAFKSLRHLGLFYLHQLLNKKGELLILWHQLKYLRKQSSRGRKADWFKKSKNAVLINRVTREVRPEFKAVLPNLLSPILPEHQITLDNRKKEWVVWENQVQDKEVRRVVFKGKARVLTEHWILEEKIIDLTQLIYPYSGCNQNQLNQARQSMCAKG